MATLSRRPKFALLQTGARPRAKWTLIHSLDLAVLLAGVMAFAMLLAAGVAVYRSTGRLDESKVRMEWIFMALSLVTMATSFLLMAWEMLRRRRTTLRLEADKEQLTACLLKLEEAAYKSRLLMGCGNELQLCLAGEQILDVTTKHLARLLPGTSGLLCLMNASRLLMEVVSHWGDSSSVIGEGFALDTCCALRLGQMRWRRQGFSEIECMHFRGMRPLRYVCIPVVAQGETLGILSVDCTSEESYEIVVQRTKTMLELLQLMAVASTSLDLRKNLENQAIRDGLTGVYNRHFMEITLERELSRAARRECTLAVFMLDVDRFKRFNDRYGHPAGDAMLKAVAQVLRLNVRTEDTVCRYGGEEFAVILPGASPEAAKERAELIRIAMSRLRVPLEGGAVGDVTVSIGVSHYTPDLMNGGAVIAAADRALYAAKRLGRNRVEIDRQVDQRERPEVGQRLGLTRGSVAEDREVMTATTYQA